MSGHAVYAAIYNYDPLGELIEMNKTQDFERCPDDCFAQILEDQVENVELMLQDYGELKDVSKEDILSEIANARATMRQIEWYMRIYTIKLNAAEAQLTGN